jgi:hypothetical protein
MTTPLEPAAADRGENRSRAPKTHGRLVELRDQNQNMNAAVSAAKALEMISDDQSNKQTNQPSPGVCIRIVNVTQPVDAGKPIVDVTPQHDELEPEPARFDPIFRVG